jgi:hypothetical protein
VVSVTPVLPPVVAEAGMVVGTGDFEPLFPLLPHAARKAALLAPRRNWRLLGVMVHHGSAVVGWNRVVRGSR